MTTTKIKRYALMSLTDKSNAEQLAQAFVEEGLELIASGGTRDHLIKHGFSVVDISEFTGEPERFGGRVKTLHHKVYSSLLLRAHINDDLEQWSEGTQIVAVACNFYPFEEKASASENFDELVEWIDIGGPTMVRAAAKNFRHVWIFTDPKQYPIFINQTSDQRNSIESRSNLAFEAFQKVATLDAAIVDEWQTRIATQAQDSSDSRPLLQYGENPHQKAFFESGSRKVIFEGKVSYNNVRDAEAAWKFVQEFDSSVHPAVAVVKHQTLCGASVALSPEHFESAFRWAWEGDPVSRFGGILGFNKLPTPALTEELLKPFIEVLVLPLSEESQKWAKQFRQHKPRVLVVLVEELYQKPLETWSGVLGHMRQEPDTLLENKKIYKFNTGSDFQKEVSTWMGACSKSNALVLTAQDQNKTCFLVGAGQGQPNRVEAFKQLAWPRARDFLKRFPDLKLENILCFSDAFLPFPDLVEAMAEAGLKRLVQPGGSKNDPIVLETAQKLNLKVEMTGRRHFWH